jgi:hypothetical protein
MSFLEINGNILLNIVHDCLVFNPRRHIGDVKILFSKCKCRTFKEEILFYDRTGNCVHFPVNSLFKNYDRVNEHAEED